MILNFKQVSHTSDHFEKCQELARKIIKDGLAYMDDTDQEKMQVNIIKYNNSCCLI